MRLIIGGQNIELSTKSKVAQTKQVNNLGSLNNRQAGFTNKFKIPLTDSNVKAMGLLGVVGNTSNVPYQLNKAYLYADSGESFIYNGFAVVKATSGYYDITVYDGNISIYKAIENKDLSTLNLEEITHNKTVANVVNSFTADLDYKYILADYNGKAYYAGGNFNIDYLVPSVKVSYLWDKIFSENNHTYSGTVFDTIEFQNLWMTYPKGVPSSVAEELLYDTNVVTFDNITPTGVQNTKESLYMLKGTPVLVDNMAYAADAKTFLGFFSGGYRIEMSGTVRATRHKVTVAGSEVLPARFDIWLVKQPYREDSDDTLFLKKLKENVGSDTDNGYYDITLDEVLPLTGNDQFAIVFKAVDDAGIYDNLLSVEQDIPIRFKFSSTGGDIIDFSDALTGFSIKDFIDEVLNRHGLTPYKHKYLNEYKFKTVEEVLQGDDIEDWSAEVGKFSEQTNETYLSAGYGQENLFRHKYNDKEASYHDGSISIDNVNLPAVKNAIVSKIYVPEEDTTDTYDRDLRVYKIWEKSITDDNTVEYKGLKNRFYFMRSRYEQLAFSRVIGSEALGDTQVITAAPFEDFTGLDYKSVVNEYYAPIKAILDKSRVILAKVFLNDRDIVDIDFAKLKYIKELGGYFILNKVSNFIKKGLTKVELISVDYTKPIVVPNVDILTVTVTFLPPNPPFDDLATVLFTWDNTQFLDSNISVVINGGAPFSAPNTGLYEFPPSPINTPLQEFTVYIYDSITTSETQTYNL